MLYGAESCALNYHDSNKLKGFHNRSVGYVKGRCITKVEDNWIYPENRKTLELSHLLPIDDCFTERKCTA